MEKYDGPKIDIRPKQGNNTRKGLLWKIFIREWPSCYLIDRKAQQAPDGTHLEVWSLFMFLKNPLENSWVMNSKIWRNEGYRKKCLADFIVNYPESIIHVEKRVQKLKCQFCCDKHEQSTKQSMLKSDELPSLETLGDL